MHERINLEMYRLADEFNAALENLEQTPEGCLVDILRQMVAAAEDQGTFIVYHVAKENEKHVPAILGLIRSRTKGKAKASYGYQWPKRIIRVDWSFKARTLE